jgi:hypothetical protein
MSSVKKLLDNVTYLYEQAALNGEASRLLKLNLTRTILLKDRTKELERKMKILSWIVVSSSIINIILLGLLYG